MDFEEAVVVARYTNASMAEAAASLLRSEGIDAVVSADDAGGELPNLDVGGGARVIVPSADAKAARQLLDSREA